MSETKKLFFLLICLLRASYRYIQLQILYMLKKNISTNKKRDCNTVYNKSCGFQFFSDCKESHNDKIVPKLPKLLMCEIVFMVNKNLLFSLNLLNHTSLSEFQSLKIN